MLKIVSNSRFGKVFSAPLNKSDDFFLKFFNDEGKHFLSSYDISPLFTRNRAECCAYANDIFSKSHKLKKYFPEILYYSQKNNFIISSDNRKNRINFSEIIQKDSTFPWLKRIRSMSNDFIYTETKIKKIPELLKNNSILRLKTNLQIKIPLLKVFAKQKVDALMKSLGGAEYLCHGDLQPKNIIFGSMQTRVVDLDEVFVGYSGFDAGFLWGNIIYLVSGNPKNLGNVMSSWRILIRKIVDRKKANNFKIITVSTILMRIFLFPLQKIKKQSKKTLINFCIQEL